MRQGVIMLGATPNTTIEEMFDELVDKVAKMKKQVEEELNINLGITFMSVRPRNKPNPN